MRVPTVLARSSLFLATTMMVVIHSRPAHAQSAETADLAVHFLALAVGGEEDEEGGGCFFYRDGGCSFGDKSCTELFQDTDGIGGGYVGPCLIAAGAITVIVLAVYFVPSLGAFCTSAGGCFAQPDDEALVVQGLDSLSTDLTSAILFLPEEHPIFQQTVAVAEAEGVEVLVGSRLIRPGASPGVGFTAADEEASPEIEWTAYDVRRRDFVTFETSTSSLDAYTVRPRTAIEEAAEFAEALPALVRSE